MCKRHFALTLCFNASLRLLPVLVKSQGALGHGAIGRICVAELVSAIRFLARSGSWRIPVLGAFRFLALSMLGKKAGHAKGSQKPVFLGKRA
jgi:hypothetical protein